MRAAQTAAIVDRMFSLLNTKRREEGDRLANAGVAISWLASAAADPATERAVITAALSVAAARQPVFTEGRLQALLLVDKRAMALQAALLDEYAAGAYRDLDRAKRITADAIAINRAVAVYCDALVESLRTNPAGRVARAQLLRLLTRQLANLRMAMMLSTLRHEKWIPLRWANAHRLYRHALRQRVHEVGRASRANPTTESGSAEWEYIQLLLIDQMNHGNLNPPDAWRAFEWLAEWGGSLRLTPMPPTTPALAVLRNGKGGLTVPPSPAESGALWLDLSELLATIDLEIERARVAATLDPGSGRFETSDRIVLLQKLRTLWLGPLAGSRRRERRIAVNEAASVVFGLSATFRAVEQSSPRRESEEIELHDVGESNGVVTAPWAIVDISLSGCRLKGKTRRGFGIGPGALFAMTMPATGTSRVGIVRRIVRRSDDESELGASIIGTNPELVALYDDPDVFGSDNAVANPTPRRPATGGAQATMFGALLLASPITQQAPRWTSVIVAAHDYREGAASCCAIGEDVVALVMGPPIERTGEFVWAAVDARVREKPVVRLRTE